MSQKLRDRLRDALGTENLLEDPGDRWAYGYDNSRRQAMPDLVGFATAHEQVRDVVRLCNEHRMALVARGRGTGTTGGTVPLTGGMVLSLERMDRILDMDPDNRWMTVEPGVTNQTVQEVAARQGFFWPPDPTSAAYCTVGGNLGYNSAGPRAVKYGTPRENTLGLWAVTGSGEEIRTGVYTTKGVVGYDLTRLLIGSEGTLAVVTRASLKLTPLPEARRAMRAVYADIHSAASAIARIMAQPVTPCTLEFIDDTGISLVRRHAAVDLPEAAGGLLLLEVDGAEACIEEAAQAVARAAKGAGLIEVATAAGGEDAAELWSARKALSPALRSLAPKKINEDIVVPVSRLPELISGLQRLSQEFGILIVNFGHAGNGNIHTNLLVDPDDAGAMERAHRCLTQVFRLVLELQGTLSGEHGVGIEKRDFVDLEIEPATLRLMQRIKAQFDPNGILNPGKMFPGDVKGD
ncbi:MAG: FAD-linked oxidase C-terminal domain-containing protein [Gammaproteobacteria bacterium]|nr:FAD-linked oxidase C-terminal domain-containing protein [Gammaproteobacteria bacterium]